MRRAYDYWQNQPGCYLFALGQQETKSPAVVQASSPDAPLDDLYNSLLRLKVTLLLESVKMNRLSPLDRFYSLAQLNIICLPVVRGQTLPVKLTSPALPKGKHFARRPMTSPYPCVSWTTPSSRTLRQRNLRAISFTVYFYAEHNSKPTPLCTKHVFRTRHGTGHHYSHL